MGLEYPRPEYTPHLSGEKTICVVSILFFGRPWAKYYYNAYWFGV